MQPVKQEIFIVGGTGYIGKRFISQLLERGHPVTALVRKGSENKVPKGARVVIGNPFDANNFTGSIPPNAVFVQLLGVAHPSPKKAASFISIDLASAKSSAEAAGRARISHIIYISVAMEPSSVMQAYQEVRRQGERLFRETNIPYTYIRPWYVLGPGHYWPIILLPFYAIATLIPSLQKKARAFGLVTIKQVLNTLINAAEKIPQEIQIVEIAGIRKSVLQR